jgi:hypothetical protein
VKNRLLSNLRILPWLSVGLIVAGCHTHVTDPGPDFAGSGHVVSEQRSVGQFQSIVLESVGNVQVTQDTTQQVVVRADDNIINRVTTRVENGVLIVGLLPGSYGNITVDFSITVTALEMLRINGAGNVSCTGPVQTDSLAGVVTGSGSMTLWGRARTQALLITGAGSVHSHEMVASYCSVMITGTGNADVYVTQQLDALITGVGNITYAGNPPVVHQQVTGIGSIARRP